MDNERNTEQFNLRLPPELIKRIRETADAEGRLVSRQVEHMLERQFAERESREKEKV